jgi:hypothetical protein
MEEEAKICLAKGGAYSFPCLPSFYLLMAIVLFPFVVNSSRQREDQGEVITTWMLTAA